MRIRTLRAFALALLPVLLAGACGSERSGNVGLAPGTIAAAAAKTVAAKSARMQMTITMSGTEEGAVAPESHSFVAEGKTELGSERAILTLDMGTLLPGLGGKMEMRVIDSVAYMKMPAIPGGGELPAGKKWIKMDIGAAAKEQGFDLGSLQRNFQTGDPAAILTFLKGAGSVKRVGTESVRGAETTHYSAVVDMTKAIGEFADAEGKAKLAGLPGLKATPVDVWIGGDGLLRRMEMALGFAGFEDAPDDAKMTMRLELFDFGVNVGDIAAPPASEVIDVEQMMGEMGAEGGGSMESGQG